MLKMDVDISPPASLNSMVDELYSSGVSHKDEIKQLTQRLDEISNLEYKLKAIQICLGPALDAVEIDELEPTISRSILPFTYRLFNKMLKDIEIEVEKNCVDNISITLQTCFEVLCCCENTLKHLAKFEKLKYEQVTSLPINIASIVFSSFDHCRSSDIIYGENLSDVTEVLTALFHKTCDVQNNLLTFLTNGVKFHCLFDDELQCLLEVMELLEKCGEVLMTLGIKPLVQQWKGYAQMASTYKEAFQTSLDIAKPVCFLANDLSQRLSKTLHLQESNSEECKQIMKELKVGAFVLKIIVKLCEQYAGYLGNCHKELTVLLVRLYGISKPFLNVSETPNEIVDFIERNITVGVGPLITTLLDDRGFIEVIKNINLSTSDNADQSHRIGLLLLCVAIMKKLVVNDKETLQIWIKSGVSFIHIIFDLIEQGFGDFELDIKIERTESAGQSDLYEAIVTHTTAYLLTSTTEQAFTQLEKFLESRIIQRKYWVALMASDIFLILSRFGNSDLKLQQAKYFVSRSVLWPPESKHTPEWIFVSNFTHRLLKLLPSEVADNLLSDYPPSVWAELGCGSIPGFSAVNVDHACKSLQTFLSHHSDSSEPSNFNNMISELLCLPSLHTDIDMECLKHKTLLPALAKLWQICDHLLFSNEKQLGYWFDKFIVDLTSASCNLLILMDNSLLNLIVRSLQQALKRNCASSKLISIEFLRVLAHIEMKSDNSLTQIFKSIACLFWKLIEDADPIISSNAVECFEYFANTTLHTRIISMTGQQSSSTQHLITSYLQRSFISDANGIIQIPKSLEYIGNTNAKHKCAVTVSKSLVSDRSESNHAFSTEVTSNENVASKSHESSNTKLISLNERLKEIVEKALMNNEGARTNERSECNVKFVIEKLENCIAECEDKVVQ
ncbi:uncharacterized protein LOC111047574 [Nilaparvata lugens]|uniref:uncharacterized protein LOC111047574 n=1 Tax=Nilaparvata lugens TaxID=108931 RepID=UPI00193CEBF3|nr:uncharacterized protein LOC111047574 [Nilaparvata lugens]